ncbi:MAG: glycosyltransferase [Microbacterium sp.]
MSGPRILFLSHTHPFGTYRVGSHHYARVLARRGADVVHVSTPISFAHRATGRVTGDDAAVVPHGPYRDADGATYLVPRTNLPRPFGVFRVARELARYGLALPFDAVLIDQPLLWDDTVRALAPRLVYRPTDHYASGVKVPLQERIVAAANGVVATSAEVLRGLGPVTLPALVLPNGVDAAAFAPPAEASEARPAVCVYAGALDARLDDAQLAAWARAHPGIRFIVAGQGMLASAALVDNVEMLGPVDYGVLPALLHGARVGLLPLSDDRLNAGRSPMKLHEYLGAGLAVVARRTPTITPDEQTGVFTYADTEDADAALRSALEHPSPNTAGIARAAAESWEAKTDTLMDFIGSLVSSGR